MKMDDKNENTELAVARPQPFTFNLDFGDKPAARASHGNVNEDNFDGSRQANGNRSRFRRGGIG